MLKRALLLLAVVAAPAVAQGTANPNTANARMLWTQAHDYIAEAAKDVPESMYSFRPTPEVRTFGELLGHVAGSEKMFCAMGLGVKPPAEDDIEKTAKTKAALTAALQDAKAYCAKAYATTDAANAAMVDVFGQQRSRMYALFMNATHDNEHYGNIVTYMRINKMVPPSSKKQ
jgi:uncharacterized damage-inducible protein DinB